MKPLSFMIVAGEPSGDLLAAELVPALREQAAKKHSQYTADLQPLETALVPRFFGAGGPRMRDAGVEVAVDLAGHAAVGVSDVLRNYRHFRRCFKALLQLAIAREPDAIICVDFSGFNLRFASAIKRHVRRRQRKPFYNWNPRLIQYVSPQVWASRPRRARRLERDVDLLLSIFPFEKDWYAVRAPGLRVEYVGHPVVDRYLTRTLRPPVRSAGFQPAVSQPSSLQTTENAETDGSVLAAGPSAFDRPAPATEVPLVALLPGSRAAELRRHLPIIRAAAHQLASDRSLHFRMPLPNDELAALARTLSWPAATHIQVGGLAETLQQATIAIASTGTVTMECAFFGLPTVALYKTSPLTYAVGKRLITVAYLAMPNVLAGQELFPEFIQHRATPDNIAHAAAELLDNPERRTAIAAKLAKIVDSLGPPGDPGRAAHAILRNT